MPVPPRSPSRRLNRLIRVCLHWAWGASLAAGQAPTLAAQGQGEKYLIATMPEPGTGALVTVPGGKPVERHFDGFAMRMDDAGITTKGPVNGSYPQKPRGQCASTTEIRLVTVLGLYYTTRTEAHHLCADKLFPTHSIRYMTSRLKWKPGQGPVVRFTELFDEGDFGDRMRANPRLAKIATAAGVKLAGPTSFVAALAAAFKKQLVLPEVNFRYHCFPGWTWDPARPDMLDHVPFVIDAVAKDGAAATVRLFANDLSNEVCLGQNEFALTLPLKAELVADAKKTAASGWVGPDLLSRQWTVRYERQLDAAAKAEFDKKRLKAKEHDQAMATGPTPAAKAELLADSPSDRATCVKRKGKAILDCTAYSGSRRLGVFKRTCLGLNDTELYLGNGWKATWTFDTECPDAGVAAACRHQLASMTSVEVWYEAGVKELRPDLASFQRRCTETWKGEHATGALP